MAKSDLTRREILRLALASPLLAAVPSFGFAQRAKSQGLTRESFLKAPSTVVPVATRRPSNNSSWFGSGKGRSVNLA